MFYERIKSLRLSTGMNQVEFGKRIGVTKQCVCNWENNNIQPSIDMVIRIARVFSVTSDYLLGLTDTISVDVSGLGEAEILHIQNVINDMKALHSMVDSAKHTDTP